jgi:hypothetical protein
MNINYLEHSEQLKGLNLDVMFAAVPKDLVANHSKKFKKRKTQNLFYIIFGVFLKESSQYIIFSSVFQTVKKKEGNNWFKEIIVDSAVFEEKQDVLDYLYDFIDEFSPHERIINEEIMNMGIMPAETAFEYLLLWNSSVFAYYNELIPSKKNKRLKLFNLF